MKKIILIFMSCSFPSSLPLPLWILLRFVIMHKIYDSKTRKAVVHYVHVSISDSYAISCAQHHRDVYTRQRRDFCCFFFQQYCSSKIVYLSISPYNGRDKSAGTMGSPWTFYISVCTVYNPIIQPSENIR
jgi:hypothetical protein